VGDAAGHVRSAEGGRQHADALHAVLKCHDDGVRSDERAEQFAGGFRVVQLHREEDDVGLADRRRILGRIDAIEVKIAERADDGQSLRPQGLEVRATCDERNVRAAAGAPRPATADLPAPRRRPSRPES
jgi:hypothetical protein